MYTHVVHYMHLYILYTHIFFLHNLVVLPMEQYSVFGLYCFHKVTFESGESDSSVEYNRDLSNLKSCGRARDNAYGVELAIRLFCPFLP